MMQSVAAETVVRLMDCIYGYKVVIWAFVDRISYRWFNIE
jgi:hypothetical protein